MPSVRDTQAYDLAFGPFQESCAAFLASLDAYVLRGKDEIQARRISHTTTMKKAAEERVRLEKEIDSEGDKEGRLLKVLEKEKAEVADLEQALAELKLTLGGVETQIRLGEGDAQEREAQLQTLLRGQSRRTPVRDGANADWLASLYPHAGICREDVERGFARPDAQGRRRRPDRGRAAPVHQD